CALSSSLSELGLLSLSLLNLPLLTVYSRNKVELGKSNILICFVNKFYPPAVKVKWTKNNVEVKEGKGDDYSCTVYHQGLTEPEIRFWGHACFPSDMTE
uniref:Ig-like domain-containing protein n=1 Tax=Paramormyrops kingsleyae TaxID=1676925 RepID=A0A3B3T185_9TELE